MALKFFPETTLLLEVDHCERILNQNIDEMGNDHRVAVTYSNFKNLCKYH